MGVVVFMESWFFPIPLDLKLVQMVLANRDKTFRIALVCTVCSIPVMLSVMMIVNASKGSYERDRATSGRGVSRL